MNNKNPFEVRLDVMKMAQEMLDKEYYANEQKYLHKLEELRRNQAPGDQIDTFIDTYAPKAYTPEEVLTRASTLYNFVASSNSVQKKGEGS
jgi:hypothetical protein